MQKITKVAVVLIAFAGTFLLGGGVALRIYAGGAEQPAALAVADDPPQAQPAKDQVKEPAPGPLPVIVQKPVWREFTPFQDFTGRLGQLSRVDVRSPIAGFIGVTVQANTNVRKGDPLFEVVAAKPWLAAQQALTSQSQAERQHQQAKRTWLDAQKEFEAGQISTEILAAASKEYESTGAAEKKAREAAEQAGRALSRIKVPSPTDGRVPYTSGNQFVKLTGTEAPVIVQIASRDAITFRFDMDERSYLQYRRLLAKGEVQGVGSTVKTQLADEEGFPGKAVITGYDSQANASTGTIGVLCSLPDPEHILLPGMFVRVRMPVGKTSRVLEIPQECIQSDLGSYFVWVVGDKNIVERRNVKTGGLDGDMVVIKEGLRLEDRVIVRPLRPLHAGEQVRPQSK